MNILHKHHDSRRTGIAATSISINNVNNIIHIYIYIRNTMQRIQLLFTGIAVQNET